MEKPILIDHLFRHSYGKMVSILTRIFGLNHLQVIEDAVQDSFYKAIQVWKNKPPENPEAWLIKASRNRVVDIIRKLKSDETRHLKWNSGATSIAIQEVFLPHEIEDSQLRMIFTACHPSLTSENQISFALKTISGFSIAEIASSLLKKEETIKKRISRARKTIVSENINFEIPRPHEISSRIHRVHDVIYLLFNEGYHSNNKENLIKKDLCLEALRLCKILINRKLPHNETSSALMALMCFHTSRLDGKIDKNGNFITLENQDRTKWDKNLLTLGSHYMNLATQNSRYSTYHFEAAISFEHAKAQSFEETNWNNILHWYQLLYKFIPSESIALNLAVVHLQLNQFNKARDLLESLQKNNLEQRNYLYHSIKAEYFKKTDNNKAALIELNKALKLVNNTTERKLIEKKMIKLKD